MLGSAVFLISGGEDPDFQGWGGRVGVAIPAQGSVGSASGQGNVLDVVLSVVVRDRPVVVMSSR